MKQKDKSERHVDVQGMRTRYLPSFGVVPDVEPEVLRKLAAGGQPREYRTRARRDTMRGWV
jgi:hypothetical protein